MLERAERQSAVRRASSRGCSRDHAAPTSHLPETVQGVIAARIDQLAARREDARCRTPPSSARSFWLGARRSGLRRERRRCTRSSAKSSSAATGVRRSQARREYAFLHLLVRDVAYGQIPRARARGEAPRAAAWIEGIAPDRSEDRAEMLAHHYREALDLALAAGLDASELRRPAKTALAEASERAAALSSWAAAEELANAAFELTSEGDPLRPLLELRIARATGFAGRPELARAQSARDGFLAQGLPAQAAEAQALISWMHWWRGEGDEAMESAARTLELARDLPSSVSKARALAGVARRQAIGGDPQRGIELGHEVLAVAEEIGHDALIASALNSIGIAMTMTGDLEGLSYLERSIRGGRPQQGSRRDG